MAERVCETPDCTYGSRSILTAQHTRLLADVAVRVNDLVRVTEVGEWPALELRSLVRYLRSDVLPQAAREEHGCYVGASPAQIAQLKRDHVRLRAATEVLAQAAAGEGNRSSAQLLSAARSVFRQLQRHIGAEQELLAV